MSELITIFIAALAVALLTRSATRLERLAAFGCLGAHVVLAWFQVWLHASYYGVSDMHAYFDEGSAIARFLDFDVIRFGPEVAKLALHQDTTLPALVIGEGSSTATMAAIDGVITYVLGPSHVTACLVVGSFATVGQWLLYRAARDSVAGSPQSRMLLLGFLFVPSVIFWSSAFSKEGLVVGFFGLLCYGAHHFAGGRRVTSAFAIAVGGVGVAVLKPYILFPFVLAVGSWYYVARSRTRQRVSALYFVVAVLLALFGLAVVSSVFPDFSISQLGEQVAMQQHEGNAVGGGSFFAMGDDQARTVPEQLPYIPLALVTSLFRPLPFEVKNAPMAAAAVETSGLAIASLVLIVRFRWRRVVYAITQSPVLAFSVVFVLTFSIAVGLATTNLGTLSRYRMPMMPFYVSFILVLARELSRAHSPAIETRA